MNTDGHDIYCRFRKIGSKGLVIFERDGLLLRRKRPSRDILLGDINDEFVEVLKHMRQLNVRFGFISDQRGMDGGTHGRSELAALTNLLDELLSLRGAMPDFWMARAPSQPNDSGFKPRRHRRKKPETDMILRAVERYGIDRSKAVFVGSSAAIFAAIDTVVTGIHYSSRRSDRTSSTRTGIEPRHSSPREITEVQQLPAMIEQILRSDHRAEQPGVEVRSE